MNNMNSGASGDQESTADVQVGFDRPIDLSTIDREQVLFYLAGHVPISIAGFAEECSQQEEEVKRILRDRFKNEVNIDSTEFLTLAPAARNGVKSASKSVLKSAKSKLESGKASRESGDLGEAATHYKKAVSIFGTVRERFQAVGYEAEVLDRSISHARKTHDSIVKRSAKDSINYYEIQTEQHETEGDHNVGNDPETALEAYERAQAALTEARAIAASYNESRLHADSQRLETESIQERLESLKPKLKAAERELGKCKSNGERIDETAKHETDTPDESMKDELLAELERLTAEFGRPPNAMELDRNGLYSMQRYWDEFGSWYEALEAADIPLKSPLIEEIKSVAEAVEGKPSIDDVNKHSIYTGRTFEEIFGSWENACDAADIEEASKQCAGSDTGYDDSRHEVAEDPMPKVELGRSESERETDIRQDPESAADDPVADVGDTILGEIASEFDEI